MQELETKIAAWRERMTLAMPDREEAVRELEEHLRDRITLLTAKGTSASEGFARAVAELGEARIVAREFERLAAPWWSGTHARAARMLAYASGVCSTAAFVFYGFVAFWGFARLLDDRVLPKDPRWAGFWQTLAVVLVVASGLAIRASGRFLKGPNACDLRGVIAFNLLALWMVGSGAADLMRIVYAAKLAIIGGLLVACGFVWREAVAGNLDPTEAGR